MRKKKAFNFSRHLQIVFKTGGAFIACALLTFISGCASPGYQCPLKHQPGGCSSQIQAYKATLNHKADGLSIFDDVT